MQLSIFDPTVYGDQIFTANGRDYRVRGLEGDEFESPRQNQDPYTTYDASLGATRDAWNVELFGQNPSDARAQLYVNDGFTSVHLVTPNRPRTLGVRFGYRF